MANQKVKDLATVQTPKDTDYIMLLTDASNNVVEKIELNKLSEIFRTNEISEDIRNALKLGTDDKLYVSDLSEDIEQVTNDLSSLSLDVEDISQEIEGIQQTISTFDSIIPDYSNLETFASNTEYTASSNGWLYVQTGSSDDRADFSVEINGLTFRNCGNTTATEHFYFNFMLPVSKGDNYKVNMGTYTLTNYFIPAKEFN